METEGTTLMQSGILLVPLFLFATLAILYVLVRRWQVQTAGDLKVFRSELRQLRTSQQDVTLALQGHTPEDPEPYGSRLRQLQAQMQDAGESLHQLETGHVALQEQAHWLNQGTFQTLVGGPYFWFMLRRDVDEFREQIEQAWQAFGVLVESVQQLERVGWEVAQKARQVTGLQQKASQVMDQLRSRGVLGSTIEQAAQQEKEAKISLEQLPLYFLEGDEQAVREQADKENTISAHGTLERVQESLVNLLAQANRWDEQFSQAHEQVGVMQRALRSLEGTLGQAPNELNVAGRQTQFGKLKADGEALSLRAEHLEIEQLEDTLGQAAHITQEAQAAEAELKQAYQSIARLEGELSELNNGLKQIALIIAGLGAKSRFPVAWGESSDRLADFNRQNTAIGPAKKPRDPAQANRDLERAMRLNEQQRELNLRLRKLEEQHAELTQIVASPEISGINPWLKEAGQLAEKVKDYAPENWPRVDAVAELPAEVQSAANDVQRLLPAGGTQAVAEADLPARLEDARHLLAVYQRLQKRIDNIRNHLTLLQREEKQSQDQLAAAQATLNQVALIVRSNPLLSQAAAQEIGRFQRDLQGALDDLAHRQRGAVDKKVKNGQALLAKFEQSANHWLDLLNQDSQQKVKELTRLLKALDEIASIEEQAVNDARRQLSSSLAYGSGGGNYAGKSKFRLEELTPEFKRRSDFWQSCAGISGALEEMAQPLLDAYEQAEQNRQQAHELLTQVAAWLRQTHDWPPCSVALDSERQEMDRIDSQWQALQSTSTRALPLMQQVGQLSARYHEMLVRMQQTGEQADREMAAAEDLENEIIELEERWENNWRNYQDEPQAAAEMRRLLDEMERDLSALKRQYKQKRNYAQALQSLKNLQRKARTYLVELDEDRSLGADGTERRRR